MPIIMQMVREVGKLSTETGMKNSGMDKEITNRVITFTVAQTGWRERERGSETEKERGWGGEERRGERRREGEEGEGAGILFLKKQKPIRHKHENRTEK